jgi:inosine-uridine nucleoside N-ribohydrolase
VLLIAVPATPVIIDTDMGTDDMMAIALILSHREIPIEAITVVNGIARVPEGAANARRLIAASGRTGIPAFEGRSTTPHNFPDEWRNAANQPINKINIPPSTNQTAEAWLQQRFKDAAHPVRILALGPLTNLASTLPAPSSKAIEEIVMMGGAFNVPGNLNGAEGNFYVDPESAAKVFRSGIPIRVIPLDATTTSS